MGCQGGGAGVDHRRSPATSWPENGRKGAALPPSVGTLSAAITAMTEVRVGLKLKILVRESCWDGRIGRRWLVGTGKQLEQ